MAKPVKADLPTPLNAPPAPRVTKVFCTVGEGRYEVYATSSGYTLTDRTARPSLRNRPYPGLCSDPQTNAQRAVQRLINEGKVPEDSRAPL